MTDLPELPPWAQRLSDEIELALLANPEARFVINMPRQYGRGWIFTSPKENH